MEYAFSSFSQFEKSQIRLIEQTLSEDEFIRLSSKPRDKYIQSLAARALLKNQLEKKGFDVSSFCVTSGADKKPILTSSKGLNISITHSHDMIGCAFSENLVGIDVQKINVYSPKTMSRICTEQEREYINSGEPLAFFAIWTMKEAYLKASGCSFAEMIKTSFVKNGKISPPDNVSKMEYGFMDDYAWSVIEI